MLQRRTITLIRPLIPSDAQDRVSRAVEQFNKPVRDQLREEMRLGAADDPGRGGTPVRVADGFPTGVARLIDRYQDEALWRLIMLQPKLGGVVEGLTSLLEHWDQFEHWLQLPAIAQGSAPEMARAAEVANALQTLAVTRRVFDEVKEIEEDILGVYRHDPRPARIEIYWMAHALFAAAFVLKT